MQCKDIPDIPILRYLQAHQGHWSFLDGTGRDDDPWPFVSRAMSAGTPSKLILAKMRTLIRRGLVDGCGCGCRGDFEITEKGLEFLAKSEQSGIPGGEEGR